MTTPVTMDESAIKHAHTDADGASDVSRKSSWSPIDLTPYIDDIYGARANR